jgi:tetraacyldisaccharide-1-P 4'-kinase
VTPASTEHAAPPTRTELPAVSDSMGPAQQAGRAPTWEQRWHDLVLGRAHGPGAAAARAGLWVLSGIYAGVIGAYRGAYDVGLLRTATVACRVISVGNLTVGGTGKSTMVCWLAGWLHARGVPVAILSYGYRAGSEEAVTVVSDGQRILVPVSESGDEPRMLAEALPEVPVLIGKRRTLSAAEAVRRFGARICVLDDGFQYWRLKKDMDVVLVDARCPFGGDHFLPRGLLREAPRQLARAQALVITNGHLLPEAERAALLQRLRCLNPDAVLSEARHVARSLRLASGEWEGGVPFPYGMLDLADRLLTGRRVLALSSLGNPEGFERLLGELGAVVVPARYPDHHHYRPEELRAEVERAREAGCAAVVTTEKDAVKLDAAWTDAFPVLVLAVTLDFDSGREELDSRLEALVG